MSFHCQYAIINGCNNLESWISNTPNKNIKPIKCSFEEGYKCVAIPLGQGCGYLINENISFTKLINEFLFE